MQRPERSVPDDDGDKPAEVRARQESDACELQDLAAAYGPLMPAALASERALLAA